MTIQFLSFPGCPHAEPALASLRAALERLGLEVPIVEIDLTGADGPLRPRGWASPTVLVDGVELDGLAAPDGICCRIYAGKEPTVDSLEKELRRHLGSRILDQRGGRRSTAKAR
jgi:hypothetical protein